MSEHCFFDVLNNHSRKCDCIFTSTSIYRVEDLLELSADIRSSARYNKGACVALSGLNPLQLITAIIALDGYVNGILLLPSTTDKATSDLLLHLAQCTHIVSSKSMVGEPIADFKATSDNGSTLWKLATSGTTGTPKIIEHTLASLSRTVKKGTANANVFHWGLLYDPARYAGLQVVLQALLSESRLTIPDLNEFSAKVSLLGKHGINALSATPSLWRKLLMDFNSEKLHLRQVTIGGEIADQMIINSLEKRFPHARITHIYASTEVGTGFAVTDRKAGFPSVWLDNPKAPVQMRVCKNDRLWIKPVITPQGRAILDRSDPDGYIDTEDLVRVTPDRVFFVGRVSGAINVGGNKVSPELIEETLRQVEGVVDARVYAKKSSIIGQVVAAEIVPLAEMDKILLRAQILAHCQSTLEKWQQPVVINFVKEMEVSGAGKIRRQIV